MKMPSRSRASAIAAKHIGEVAACRGPWDSAGVEPPFSRARRAEVGNQRMCRRHETPRKRWIQLRRLNFFGLGKTGGNVWFDFAMAPHHGLPAAQRILQRRVS